MMPKRDAFLAHDYSDGDLAPIKPAIAASFQLSTIDHYSSNPVSMLS
jgi:hypothetical protein